MRWSRRPPVVPPENVCLTMADGSQVPVECVYEGWDGEAHVWRAVTELGGRRPESMSIGMLPGHTKVAIGWPA